MIVTAKPRISFLWQLFIAAPWAVLRFKTMVMGGIFIFSLKKFIENPAGITFILSVPTILAIVVNPVCSFLSDRIWTKWGRRKPFAVPSLLGVTAAFIAIPLMPNFWALLAAFLLCHISHELGAGAAETLKQEVVPPRQRTAAAAIGTWMSNLTNILFYICALGRFDDCQFFAGLPVTGEESIYWGIGAALLMMALLLMLGVKETPQPSPLRGQRLTLRSFFGGLLDRNLWPVYLLITGWAVSNAGLGALGALLYTEQWGFTKQEMGINIAVGGVINIFVIAAIGLFAHKLPRMRTFKTLLFISIFVELAFYCYVEFVLFDKTPTLPEVILFGEIASIVGILLGLMYNPLVYDYIPRNEMGTFAAGSSLVGKSVSVLTLNGVGLFVAGYTALFMPPAGDMVRVAFPGPLHEREVADRLKSSGNPALQNVSAEAWFATNASLDRGRVFELRAPSPDREKLLKERDELSSELGKILAQKGNSEAAAERARIAGNEARKAAEKAASLAARAEQLQERIAALDAELAAGAARFREQAAAVLKNDLIGEGSEWMAASAGAASVYRFPLAARPSPGREARLLNALRVTNPEVIDAHTVFENNAFHFDAAVEGDGSSDPRGGKLAQSLAAAAEGRVPPEVLPRAAAASSVTPARFLTLDAAVAEDPLNSRLSPVTKAIYWLMDFFTDAPPAERRIWAAARALRDKTASPFAGISDRSQGESHAIRVRAVFPAAPAPLPDSARDFLPAMSRLLGGDETAALAAANLAARLIPAAAQNRLTVLRPVLAEGFAPPKYDYMSGYLWIILMSCIGFAICILFTRREERGLIRRRGQEESEREAKLQAESAAAAAAGGREDRSQIPYVPGYVPQKIAMLLLGAAFVAAGLCLSLPRLLLLARGEWGQAVSVRVVKERPGGTPQILTSDAEILKAAERFDRSYVFWNEFRITLPGGTTAEFRAPSGMQLRPAHPILDAEGLPATVPVVYDPARPEEAILPAEISTWFFPGTLILFGLLGVAAAAVLLYHARKPVMMPNLTETGQPDSACRV